MSVELRTGAAHVTPFGEAFSPSCIVLGNRMELRQVERDQGRRQRPRQDGGSGVAMADRQGVSGPTPATLTGVCIDRQAARRTRHQKAKPGEKPDTQAVTLALVDRRGAESQTEDMEAGRLESVQRKSARHAPPFAVDGRAAMVGQTVSAANQRGASTGDDPCATAFSSSVPAGWQLSACWRRWRWKRGGKHARRWRNWPALVSEGRTTRSYTAAASVRRVESNGFPCEVCECLLNR